MKTSNDHLVRAHFALKFRFDGEPFKKFIVAKFGVFGDPVLSVVVLDAQHENRKAKDLTF